MEIKLGERTTTPKEENEKRRKYVIENYKGFMPDIEEYIYERKKPNFDYSFLNRHYRNNTIQKRFNELANIVVDIRNNTAPTNYYSNSINKTDNKYSNETKKLIKHLLSKGWTNNEVAYELEKIYGSGCITYYYGLDPEPTLSTILFASALKIFSLYVCFRFGRYVLSKSKSKSLMSK